MHSNMQLFSRIRRYGLHNYWVVIPWLIALFLGTYCAAMSDPSVFSLVRRPTFGKVSTVCLMAAQLLPFLFAAYAAYISNSILLISVGSVKLFSFGFIGYLIWAAFGSAGWLIRFLMLFSDVTLVPILCLFCLRIHAGRTKVMKELLICMGIVVMIVLLDGFFFSTLLEKMIYN